MFGKATPLLHGGLIKGSAKPPSFKLGRSNLFGEQGTVFDYMVNPEAPGTWCQWDEQISLVTVSPTNPHNVEERGEY